MESMPEIASSDQPELRSVLGNEEGYFSPAQGAVLPVPYPTFKDLEIPRKLFHMFGSIIAWIYLFSGLTHRTAVMLLAVYASAMLLMDLARLMLPSLNSNYTRIFKNLMRPTEAKTLNTSTYFVLGSLAVVAFFPKPIAIVSILYLAFGDPMAAIVGIRFGRTRFFGKSLEGSLGCFFTCTIIGLFFFPPSVAVLGALIATISEVIPFPVNDNFRIPIFSALGLMLLL